MKQTPINQVVALIYKMWQDDEISEFTFEELRKKIQYELLEEEKQEIIDAYNEGYRDGSLDDNHDKKDISEYSNAEQYYNQTFKK